jgi:predicted homoserine dehydrogenase-like protein
MIYENLFQRIGDRIIRAGLIGTGTYGISLLAQAQFIPQLEIAVVCDQGIETARHACDQAGIPEEGITVCSSRRDVLRTMEEGRCAVIDDHTILRDVPLDVIVECTGDPEAGARHADMAIANGMHVAMVTKETDSVIGPILKYHADRAGLVYTPVDGDQHGLLIGLVSWVRTLGLEIICGGKARPRDIIYNELTRAVTDGSKTRTLSEREMEALSPIARHGAPRAIENRRKILCMFPRIAAADLCESVIAANATGLHADIPTLHAPIVRIAEIPEVLCGGNEGGILTGHGAVEVITCLRRNDEAGPGGGVFVVFRCENEHAWNFVKAKGLPVNREGTAGLILRPYHLLGLEAPVSVLCAGLLNISTGGVAVWPRVDLVARAQGDLEAGAYLEEGHREAVTSLEPRIAASAPIGDENPVPFFMAVGNRVKGDVSAGSVITGSMVEPPAQSRLWDLRREQDRMFVKNPSGKGIEG